MLHGEKSGNPDEDKRHLTTMVARFLLVRDTITIKLYVPNEHRIYQMDIKYPKCSQNIPNGRKICQPFPI
jgi:hypothetical protein